MLLEIPKELRELILSFLTTKELEDLFIESCKTNNVWLVDVLIKFKINPSVRGNAPIKVSSELGHIKVVEILLKDPRVNPSTRYNTPIKVASWKGRLAVVERLLLDPRVDPSDCYNYAICRASEEGHKGWA